MPERIPKSIAKLVVFRAVLASDGITAATGKTIPITISKNGGAFSNPNAGATNATEISSGFYKFTLAAADVDTVGPLAWQGSEGTIVDVGDVFTVEGDVTIAGQLIIQNGISVTCSTAGRTALVLTGNGAGSGLGVFGGASGGGITVTGTGGAGINVTGATFGILSSGVDAGIKAYGSQGPSLRLETNANNQDAVEIVAGVVTGDGIAITTTSGHGIDLSGISGSGKLGINGTLSAISTDTIVAGVTIAEALRRQGAMLSGKVINAGTGTETFKDYAESAATIVITVDSSGNRSAITYN